MKFDFVIGNPPYQEMDGGAQASATPIYQHFIRAAKDVADVVEAIIPARWMTGGKGLNDFRNEMIHDDSVKLLHDYASAKEIFPGTDIKGGVCIFMRDKHYHGVCKYYRHTSDGISFSERHLKDRDDDVCIREYQLIDIKNKVWSTETDSLARIVSARKPYSLAADTMRNAGKYGLPEFSEKKIDDGYEILGLGDKQKRTWKYIPKDYPLPKDGGLGKWKVFVPEAYGCGAIGEVPSTPVLGTPVLGTPVQLCTETFLQIGPFDTEEKATNMMSYLKTKFFRALVSIKKQTQHTTHKVYQFVPMQDFTSTSDIDWSKSISEIDQQLYKKYGLTQEEIDFIESKVRSMETPATNEEEGE